MTTTRIYQLDTISQSDIKSTHVAPFEDNAGVDTTQITLAQLTQYFFNNASLTDDSGPFSGYPLVAGSGNSISDVESATNVTVYGSNNEISRDDGGPTSKITTLGASNNVMSENGAMTLGYQNNAWGPSNTACGYKNTAMGETNSVFGVNNLVSGAGCTGVGYYNYIHGELEFANVFGSMNQVYDGYSTVVGNNNQIAVPYGTAIGSSNNVYGLYSQAVGFRNFTSMVTWSYSYYDITSMSSDDGEFVISGNQVNQFHELILVTGNEDPLNNGVYEINSIDYEDDGNTHITVDGTILGENSSSGYIFSDLNFTAATSWPINGVNTTNNYFQIAGDHTVDYQYSTIVEVSDSAYNDGYYPINNVYYNDDGHSNTNIYVAASIPSSNVDGNIVGNKADEDLGWGASAFGYKNMVSDSQSQAFGHYNSVNARQGTAVGTYNSTNSIYGSTFGAYNIVNDSADNIEGEGWGASAVGYKNQALASQTTAFGHKNIASGRMAVAVGSGNTSSSYYSISLGSYNTASGYSAIAIGGANTASGKASTACGYENTASGNYSTAIGYYAVARPAGVVNIGGSIVMRADNNEGSGVEFTIWGSAENIVMTESFDLTQTTTYTITVPTHCSFYVDEVGIIVTGTPSGITNQPIVSFGWTGTTNGLVSSVITTNLLNANSREVYTGLSSYDGLQSLVFSINNGASADSLTGRAYFKGMLVENTPISYMG